MNNPTQAHWAAMSKIVQQFYSKPDAEPFREEVKWKMLGLFDYPQIIKKAMDLGKVKKKMSSKQYKTIHDCAQDVRLVWNNCMTYNADGSEFFVLAQGLSKKWEDKYQKMLSEQQLSDPASGTSTEATENSVVSRNEESGDAQRQVVSLEDKRAFAKTLYKVSKEELGKILMELDQKSPTALIKNMAEDEVEINVDNIKVDVFHELVKYVDSCTTRKKKKISTKKQKTSN